MKTLDTNICSYILRDHPRSVLAQFQAQASERFFLSALVVAELRFGVLKRGSAKLSQSLEAFLAGIPCHPWPARASQCYAELRADLEKRGQLIGNMDMLIAAHALAEGAVLVTHNTREFERVSGLVVENWV